MSRTFRRDSDDQKVLKDNKSRRSYTYGKRMKPYSKTRGKFTITTSTGNENSYHIVDKVTETAKLVRNNANRSLKKSVRQQAKRDIEVDMGTEVLGDTFKNGKIPQVIGG